MAKAHLFDTDVLIDAGRGESEAMDALEQAAEDAPLAISVITEMDLIVGCRNKDELAALDSFLRRFDVIPLRPAISEQATALLRTFRLIHGLLIADALIAATDNDAIMEKMDTEGHVIGFSILNVSQTKDQAPLSVTLRDVAT